jgi:hypothetical protein
MRNELKNKTNECLKHEKEMGELKAKLSNELSLNTVRNFNIKENKLTTIKI